MNEITQAGKEGTIPLRRYKLKELSELYGVHRDTFLNWLKPFQAEIGNREGHYYTIVQVEIIFQKLDLPSLPFNDKKLPENLTT